MSRAVATLHVVAGVLQDEAGRALIAERTAGRHMAGWWEFPGGKVGPEESPERALVRELHEELGVEVLACQPLMQLTHEYEDRTVLLQVYDVESYRGVPTGREGQGLRWVAIEHLAHERLLPADEPIVYRLVERVKRI